MIIHITESHIHAGIDGHCRECPTALAINDVLNDKYYSVVRTGDIYINHKTEMRTKQFNSPPEVMEFVKEFDRTGKIEPMSFELEIPKHMLKEQK